MFSLIPVGTLPKGINSIIIKTSSNNFNVYYNPNNLKYSDIRKIYSARALRKMRERERERERESNYRASYQF